MNAEHEKLDNLRKRVSESEDILLFDEAVKCLSAGAYRAAYIVTWICVAESIRNRFVSMSRRDAEIGKIVGQIENAEKNDRPTDRLLLDKAFELGIITFDEKEKLDHMRVMRNIYAHPTGAGPTNVEVLAALTIAVDAILSKPPLMHHGYVQNILKSLFEDIHYLDDVPILIREFATGVARRVHPDVMPYLLENLLQRLEQTMDDPALALFRRRGLEFGTTVLTELRLNLSDGKWNIVQIVQKYPVASSTILSTPDVWPLLPKQAKDMVLGRLAEPVRDNEIQPPTSIGLQRLQTLAQASLLSKRQRDRVIACTERAPYPVLRAAGIHLKAYSQRIIPDLASHNWYIQNPACDALLDAGKRECNRLDKGTQEQLGRNVLQAADGQATHAENFIVQIIQSNDVWPRAFVEGIILEPLVNEKLEFRFKGRHFSGAIVIASQHPKSNEIFNRVIKEVKKSKPKYFWHKDCDEALQVLAAIRPQLDTNIHQHLDALVDAIACVKSQVEDEIPF